MGIFYARRDGERTKNKYKIKVMKLSAENIQSNWKVFLHNIETHI